MIRRVPAATAFRLTARGAARRSFLERLARIAARLPTGEGLLLEGTGRGGPLTVFPSDPRVADVIRTLADEPSGVLSVAPPYPPPAPDLGPRRERWGRLHGAGPPARLLDPTVPVPNPPRFDRPSDPAIYRRSETIPPSAWLGVQSHWIARGTGELAIPTRFWLSVLPGVSGSPDLRAADAIVSRLGEGFTVEWEEWTDRRRERWESGRLSAAESLTAPVVSPELPGRLFDPIAFPPFPSTEELEHHLVLLGASGSGKTTLLATLAERAISRGEPVVLVDVHGDLAPSVLSRLRPGLADRVVALDPSLHGGAGPGVAVLDDRESSDRTAAHVVAALKRLSADGTDLYWGFRLERIFDTFVRLAQEQGGTLLDVYDLLTNADRRDSARLSTALPAAERFLSELPGLLKRNPEYLGPATSRLARIALSTPLARLLAPDGGAAVPIERLLSEARSVMIRLPLGELGPEASAFAATLLLTRFYLVLTRPRAGRPVLLVLDEAQAFSPRLLAEILTEGRKFGVRAAIATQYPDRLAPELRHAAAGAAGTHVVFRLPPPAARTGSSWAGLSATEAETILPRLLDGWAVVSSPLRDAPRLWRATRRVGPAIHAAWAERVQRTRDEFGGPIGAEAPARGEEDALLLALAAARAPRSVGSLLDDIGRRRGREVPMLLERLGGLARRGLVVQEASMVSLTAAGARWLGASSEHGASREGAEHRQLLLEAFRIFATHDERIEILPQGRFDTRLPDAVLRLLGSAATALPPEELARRIDARKASWAWRYSKGRDLYIEAEVSGADRSERIRRGFEKAETAKAFALFLVGDARRARRVREVLHRSGAPHARWAVWTLPVALVRHGLGG